MASTSTRSAIDNICDLAVILSADMIERLDILLMEARHFQTNLSYVLDISELNMLLRFEEDYLWCTVERLETGKKPTEGRKRTWDDLFDDIRIGPHDFANLSEVWVPRLPSIIDKRQDPMDHLARDGEVAFKDVIRETASPFYRQRIVHPIKDRVRHCHDTGRIDEAFLAEYRCFDALQSLKRNILIDKLHLCWWVKQATRHLANEEFYEKDVTDPDNRHFLLGRFVDNFDPISQLMIVRAGAMSNLHVSIDAFRDLKGQLDKILDLETQDRLRPFMDRRREQGLYNDNLAEKTISIYAELEEFFSKKYPGKFDFEQTSAMHFSGLKNIALNTPLIDSAKSFRSSQSINATKGRPVFAYHLVHSSFFMPDRPDLQPLLAHECAHGILRSHFDDLVHFGRLQDSDEFTELIRGLSREMNNYHGLSYWERDHIDTRELVIEIMSDLLAATVYGPSYLYALLQELIGYQFQDILNTPQADGLSDLSMAVTRFSSVGVFGKVPLDASWYIRLRLLCRWIEKTQRESDSRVLTGDFLQGTDLLCRILFEFVEKRCQQFHANWGPYWREMLEDMEEVLDKSGFCEAVKSHRENAENLDKCALGEEDGVPLHGFANTERLYPEVRDQLIDNLVAQKIDRARRLDKSLYEDPNEELKEQVRFFFKNYLPGVPASERKLAEEHKRHSVPIFRYAYDIPWQAGLLRARSFGLSEAYGHNAARGSEPLELTALCHDFSPGRESYFTALEFVSFAKKRPVQRLRSSVRRVVNLFSDPNISMSRSIEPGPADRKMDYLFLLNTLAREYAREKASGDSWQWAVCESPYSLVRDAVGPKSVNGKLLIEEIVIWYLGQDTAEALFSAIRKISDEGEKETRFGIERQIAEVSRSLISGILSETTTSTQPFARTGYDLRRKIIAQAAEVRPFIDAAQAQGRSAGKVVHRKVAKAFPKDEHISRFGALHLLALYPRAGRESMDERPWRSFERLPEETIEFYEVLCRCKVGALGDILENAGFHEQPEFSSLFEFAHNLNAWSRNKEIEHHKDTLRELDDIRRAIGAIGRQNRGSKELDRITVKKLSRISIADSLKFWVDPQRPQSIDGIHRFDRARFYYDISWRTGEDTKPPQILRSFNVLGKYDSIMVADAAGEWRWRLPVQERHDLSVPQTLREVLGDLAKAYQMWVRTAPGNAAPRAPLRRSELLLHKERMQVNHGPLGSLMCLKGREWYEIFWIILYANIRRPPYGNFAEDLKTIADDLLPYIRDEVAFRLTSSSDHNEKNVGLAFDNLLESAKDFFKDRQNTPFLIDVIIAIAKGEPLPRNAEDEATKFLNGIVSSIEAPNENATAEPIRRPSYLSERFILPFLERRELGLRCSIKGTPLELSRQGGLKSTSDIAAESQGIIVSPDKPEPDVLAFISIRLARRHSRLEFLSRLRTIIGKAEEAKGQNPGVSSESLMGGYVMPLGSPSIEQIGVLFEEGDHAYLTEGWGDLMLVLCEYPESHGARTDRLETPNRLATVFLIQQAIFNDWMVSRTDLHLRPQCVARAMTSNSAAAKAKRFSTPPEYLQEGSEQFFHLRQEVRLKSDRSRSTPAAKLVSRILRRARAMHIGGILYGYFAGLKLGDELNIKNLDLVERPPHEGLEGNADALYQRFLSSLCDFEPNTSNPDYGLMYDPDHIQKRILQHFELKGSDLRKELDSHDFKRQIERAFTVRRNRAGRAKPRDRDLIDYFVSVQQSPGRNDVVLYYQRERIGKVALPDVRLAAHAWSYWSYRELARLQPRCSASQAKNGGHSSIWQPQLPEDGFSLALRGFHWMLPDYDSEDIASILAYDHVASLRSRTDKDPPD